MVKAIIQLLKNIFSGQPFEQTISIEFSIYDVLFLVLIIILAIKLFL